MNPHPLADKTRVLASPLGMEMDCCDLEIADMPDPIWRNCMVSAWMPTDEERSALAQGMPVMLSIVGPVGGAHPVVAVYVGALAKPD